MNHETRDRIEAHLAALVRWADGRPVGSAANRAAEVYIAEALRAAGYEVERQGFDCIDWAATGIELRLGNELLAAKANPFSPPCDVVAPLVPLADLDALEAAELTGQIAFLHGGLTAEPLIPRNFPFFTIEAHRRIVDLLEAKGAAAVVCVNPSAQGGPIIEDGDFVLPSVTVPPNVGARLLAARGPVALRIDSASRPGQAANVIGRMARPAREKLLLTAHFDTKPDTPGALDNAAGVATVLALAEQLATRGPAINLEVVAFNGEDHYAAPGEMAYIAGGGGEIDRIALVVNVDGVGMRGAPVTLAFFNCPDAWADSVRETMRANPAIEETEPWPQGDHSIFAMQGVACVALTSGGILNVLDSIIHTPADTLDGLEPGRMAAAVSYLSELLTTLGPPQRHAEEC